jgi:arylsulfatase A-like enzyme
VAADPACLTDLLATVAEITGASLPRDAGEDSFSLVPAMHGRRGTRDHLIHHSSEGMFSIRQGQWKLVLGRGSGGFTEPRHIEPGPGEPQGQLYNIARDPEETDDVYSRYPEQVARMTALLEKFRAAGRSR